MKETTFPVIVFNEDDTQTETTGKMTCGVITIGNMDFATKIEGDSIDVLNIVQGNLNVPAKNLLLKIHNLPWYEAKDWEWNTENDYSTSINLRVANI